LLLAVVTCSRASSASLRHSSSFRKSRETAV
jgi:hypothetical protein